MTSSRPPRRKAGSLPMLLGAGLAAIVLALLTQRALAEQVGGVLAGAWVSTMGAVMSILAAFLGA